MSRLPVLGSRPSRLNWEWFAFPAGIMAAMAGLKFAALHTGGFDLGIYLSHCAGLFADGFQWWRMARGHVQPLLPLWAGLGLVLPAGFFPTALLASQAALLFLPAPWVASRYGALAGLAWVLFFPLWYVGLFDFHPDHLAVPLLAAFLLLEEDGRTAGAWVAAAALCLIKEPMALQTAACGLYLLLRRKPLAGLSLAAIGAAWFWLCAGVLIPAWSPRVDAPLNSAYVWLGNDLAGILKGLFTQPGLVLAHLAMPGKAVFLLALFGSLAFVPLLAPQPLLLLLPPLALALLSDNPGYYGLGHHYTAGMAAPLLIAFARGVPVARRLARRIGLGEMAWGTTLALVLLAAHVAIAPSPAGRLFWTDKVWSYGWRAYLPTSRDTLVQDALERYIPVDPAVAVAAQNTLTASRLALRGRFFIFDYGVFSPEPDPASQDPARTVLADYLALDLRRPWYIKDQGCAFYYGRCTDETAAARFRDLVDKARATMDTVYENDGLLILKRRAEGTGRE